MQCLKKLLQAIPLKFCIMEQNLPNSLFLQKVDRSGTSIPVKVFFDW